MSTRNPFYQILSPDGFSIQIKVYRSVDAAKTCFESWKNKFETQGYYSSNNGRIALRDLEYYCTLIEIPFLEGLHFKKKNYFSYPIN